MDDFDYELAKKESEKLLPDKVRRVEAFCSRVIHKAIGGNSLKKQLSKVNERLDQANRSAEKLLKLMEANKSGNMQLPEQENQFITSSVPSGEIIFGREKERELIIEWISEKKAGPPTIIPIVGQGGLGKTALAQLILNDPRLNSHFESNQKMWLTVSDNFDKIELTKQMLKYLCENFSTSDANFDILQRKLQTELSSKKILLILDDVWYVKDNNQKYSYEKGWLEFLAPLMNTKAGSTIILTTREDLVVNSFASLGSIRQISLHALNDDDGWSLLKLKAFDGGNPDNLHDLEPIGRNIVKKLNGLPLAIRVVGPRLRGKFNILEWKRILEDDSLDNDIMEVLHRSYEHLPAHLQRCFAYCSLFPKDYNIKRDRLIHMWIAHGFVLPNKRERLEDIGKSYFSELIARSFIQVIKRNNKEYYVLHDLMNDLACHVSKGECYKEGDTLENLDSVRHLFVTTRKLADLANIFDLDKLRTLILIDDFFNHCRLEDVLSEVFIQMKRIRVLHIDYMTGFACLIEKCKLLRYLCLRNCWPEEIAPDTFNKFHLLTALFIRKQHKGLQQDHMQRLKLPQSICSMSRLEIIDTSKSITMRLGGHVQLHSIWKGGPAIFIVEKKDGWELDHLRDFNNIKDSLGIYGLENVASRKKAIEAQLDKKKHVTKLQLRWDRKSRVAESNIEHNEILEALRPHPNIERLQIDNYLGDKFPSWLESNWFSGLTNLALYGHNSRFKKLPALGQLSQLKKLCFSNITTVSRIGDEFYGNGIFPSLEELEFNFMDGLEEWSSPHGVRLFPKLQNVMFYSCRDLFSLPEIESFRSLESVTIQECLKIRSLPKFSVSLRSLEVHGLHPDLKQFYGNDIFPSLEELYIGNMKDLEEWSCPCGVHSFPKLRKVILYDCPNLFSLPEMKSICSLEYITIHDCKKIWSLPTLPVSLRYLNVGGLHPDSKQFYDNDIFPSLEELEFWDMKSLEEWSSPNPNGDHSFPKLRKLYLSGCPNLFSLPEMESFCSLESVHIEYCPKIGSLPKLPVSLQSLFVRDLHLDLKLFYDNNIFPSLKELYISNIKGLEEWSSPCGVHSFPMLRKITLYYCPDLSSLPEMESFCSLNSVEINKCPKIRSLPKLPISLRNLNIDGVHPDLEEQLGIKNGPEWDKIAAVSGCRCIIYLDGRWVELIIPREGEEVEEGDR